MMFFIICMLGACTAEELAGPESGVEDDAPVVIAISPADITSVNMNSRAAGDNSIFSVIDDVNVKVNYGGNTVIVYLVKNGDSFEVSGSVENGSAEVVSSKTADGKVYIHINAKQGNQAVRVEVIANYGRKITLSLWQSVKESLIQWPVDFDETSVCLLYGASEQFIYTENPHEGAQGGNKGCYLAKVSLKRPYAMIKVNINTSGLDNEVTLTPRSVQLCNVPKTCTLASDNSITDFTSFDKEGQKYDFPSGSLLTGPSGNGETQVMSERLYQFENKQTVHAQNCTDAQNGNEKVKTPNRIKNTMEAGKEVYAAFTDYTDNENLGRRCSYILVTADYEYKSSSAHVKGTISYRLFLGKNISYDFDVNRNIIYNVTLHLRGAGGVKESGCMDENGVINISGNTKDAQWRVDSELSDLFIQFNEGQDYNIDGHLVKIKVVSTDRQKWQIKVDDFDGVSGDYWVMFESDMSWITPRYDEYNVIQKEGTAELRMYLKGYADQKTIWEKEWNSEKPYRSCNIYVRKLDAQNKPVAGSEMKYPIKQWYPIQITEQLYVDRIDRFAVGGLPWGDNGYTTNLTDGQKIIKEYYKKINKEHYSSDNDERSVMDNAIGVAVNSSGSSTPVTSGNSYMVFYHFSLPAEAEWQQINGVITSSGIKYNNWSGVPYWTATTEGTQSKVYIPGQGVSENRSRNESHRFRLVWRYNSFRYYSPKMGMYISSDPIGLAGGNPTLYGYVFDPNTQVDPFGLDCDKVNKARARQHKMLQDNKGFNISPTDWDAYPSIGRNGTFITDCKGALGYFGNFKKGDTITISSVKAAKIESDMGLNPGSLQNGFKIREVSGISSMNPRSPLEGNEYFLGGGQHLPGGAPEMVINSIPTTDNASVTTILTVLVK